ncbi:lipopolysaccharide kinase InaA family protein [Pseudomonas fluorescens]
MATPIKLEFSDKYTEQHARESLLKHQDGMYAKPVFVGVKGGGETARVEVVLLDLEKSRRRLSSTLAALHDMKKLRRHSSSGPMDWQKLSYFYSTAFGSAIKGLE